MTEKLYFDDPLRTEFTATITGTERDERGFRVVLPSTLFYPTGGGQTHDTGTIGTARVLDVFYAEDKIIHLLDRDLPPGEYPAKIDWTHRFANMQHHSGQHIFSAVFWHELGRATLSSHISYETPSTIDFDAASLSPEEIVRAEEMANRLVFENRALKTYFVDSPESVPFRRPPKVAGEIRVVEIDGYDYSACGGTHVPQAGMVGMLKIIRTERINQKTRIHFTAGWQTLAFLQKTQNSAQKTAGFLATGISDLPEAVEKLSAQLKSAQHELKSLRELKLEVEAEKMVQHAEEAEGKWLVTKLYENRPPAELRLLGLKLRAYPGVVAVLGSFDGKKLSLVTACAEKTGVNASDLLKKHLAPFNARGGGDQSIAQGGGTAEDVDNLFNHSKEFII
jgi:alanyl-tRNA synthetase